MRASFGAPLAGLGLVLASLTLAYFLASAASGPLTGRLGTSGLLVGGCGLSAVAWLGLALSPEWWIVPLVSFVAGARPGPLLASPHAPIPFSRAVSYTGLRHATP